jgi:hypothetical protein
MGVSGLCYPGRVLLPGVKDLRYPLERRLGGTQRLDEHFVASAGDDRGHPVCSQTLY